MTKSSKGAGTPSEVQNAAFSSLQVADSWYRTVVMMCCWMKECKESLEFLQLLMAKWVSSKMSSDVHAAKPHLMALEAT